MREALDATSKAETGKIGGFALGELARLGVLSECSAGQIHAVRELEEGVVHVVVCFPSNAQAAWSVEVGDPRCDVPLPQPPAGDVKVVAAVGVENPGAVAGTASSAADVRNRVDQRQELSDVVAVAAGQRHTQRNAVRIAHDVVLGARSSSVNILVPPPAAAPNNRVRCEEHLGVHTETVACRWPHNAHVEGDWPQVGHPYCVTG